MLLHELTTHVEVKTQIAIFANCRHMDIEACGGHQCFLCRKKLENALTVRAVQVGSSRLQLTFDCYYACKEKKPCYLGESVPAKNGANKSAKTGQGRGE